MDTFSISQILAAVAFAFGIASFQFRTRRSILQFWFASALFNAAHFFVLARPGVGFLVLLTAIRFLIASYSTDKRLMYVFLAIAPVGFLYTYQSPVSFLALFATLLGTYGSFRSKDMAVRIIMMACALSWVIHNSLVGSWVAVLMEASFLASNLVALRRFHSQSGD